MSKIEDKIHQKEAAAIALHSKTFSAWVTAQFRNADKKFNCTDITEELRTGELFNSLVEVLGGQKNPIAQKGGELDKTHLIFRLQNISLALNHLKRFMPWVDIEPKAIEDREKKVILGLIFQMIMYFKLSRVLGSDGSEKSAQERISAAQKRLLEFLQEKTKGYEGVDVKDLGSSWHDGKAVCALINKFDPNYLDYNSLDMSPEGAEDRLRVAFEVAKEKMDIPILLDPKDLVNPDPSMRPDEQCISAYLSEFPPVFFEQQEDAMKRLEEERAEDERNRAEAERQRLLEKEARRKAKEEAREKERKMREVEERERQLAEQQRTLEAQRAYEKERKKLEEEREKNTKELDEIKQRLTEEKNRNDAKLAAQAEALEKEKQRLASATQAARANYEAALKQAAEEREATLAEKAKLLEEQQQLLTAKKLANEERRRLQEEQLKQKNLLAVQEREREIAERQRQLQAQQEYEAQRSKLADEKARNELELSALKERLLEEKNTNDEELKKKEIELQEEKDRLEKEAQNMRKKYEDSQREANALREKALAEQARLLAEQQKLLDEKVKQAEQMRKLAEEKSKHEREVATNKAELKMQEKNARELEASAKKLLEESQQQLNDAKERLTREQERLANEKAHFEDQRKLTDAEMEARRAATEREIKRKQAELENMNRDLLNQRDYLNAKHREAENRALGINAAQRELNAIKEKLENEKKRLAREKEALEHDRKLSDEEYAREKENLQAQIDAQQSEIDKARRQLDDDKMELRSEWDRFQNEKKVAEEELNKKRREQERALRDAIDKRRMLVEGVLTLTIEKCSNLKTKKSDYLSVRTVPQARVECALVDSITREVDQSHKTTVAIKGRDPVWNSAASTFKYFVRSTKGQELEFYVSSHHSVLVDAFLGYCRIDLLSLENGKTQRYVTPLIPRKYIPKESKGAKKHQKELQSIPVPYADHKRGTITVSIMWERQD